MQPGELVELSPHDLSLDGGSIARLGALVVFLDRGLPGQTVRARITGRKKAFAMAEVTEILVSAKDGAPPYCPHQGACGGCAWPGLGYAEELLWKERHVRESLRRLGRLGEAADSLCPPLVPSPRPLGYRNKLEFAFAPDADGGVILGLKCRGTHRIVPVGDCALARSSVAAILAFTRRWAGENALSAWDGKTGFLRHLVVRQPDYAPQGTPQCQVELIVNTAAHAGAGDLARAFGPALRQAVPAVSSFVLSQRLRSGDVAYGDRVLLAHGPENIHERIGPLLLEAPPTAFLQANTPTAALMHAEARRLALPFMRPSSTLVWDLYCGVGGIGLFLANRVLRVHGFEKSPSAVACARRNAARNKLHNCAFTAGDVAVQARRAALAGDAPDIIITDPPRAGLNQETSALLLTLQAAAIIAVSCDPACQARDLARLAAGYRIRHVQAFDFFPHTPHVESIALLERRA
ncbi:MAG: 23S rRNA (uracil(1939)-C(5))-methyltransferase RlmD [Deltaproteobacteria bacterium]|jgi:23S rRNA (uracil1939-C5)-methyltransferase|nr:23S rRNA (uracil(1939)-C(5))-methyltransferase RlmD [Deltaproteobacteria bacterium]